MTATADFDRNRLARLPGMLGSTHPGEVANAGRAADRMVRAAGLDWPAVLKPDQTLIHDLAIAEGACRLLLDEIEELKAALAQRRGDRRPVEDCRLAYWAVAALVCRCLLHRHWLNDWERNFLRSLARRRRALSVRQADCLCRISRQLRVA
jgi:hypothetical protein